MLYLLQKDRQLSPELFLQLLVSSKQGVIHQNLVEKKGNTVKQNDHSTSGYAAYSLK